MLAIMFSRRGAIRFRLQTWSGERTGGCVCEGRCTTVLLRPPPSQESRATRHTPGCSCTVRKKSERQRAHSVCCSPSLLRFPVLGKKSKISHCNGHFFNAFFCAWTQAHHTGSDPEPSCFSFNRFCPPRFRESLLLDRRLLLAH